MDYLSLALAMRRGSERFLEGTGDFAALVDGDVRLDSLTMAYVGQGHALPELPLSHADRHAIADTLYHDFGWILREQQTCAICGIDQDDTLHYLSHLGDTHQCSISYQIHVVELIQSALRQAN